MWRCEARGVGVTPGNPAGGTIRHDEHRKSALQTPPDRPRPRGHRRRHRPGRARPGVRRLPRPLRRVGRESRRTRSDRLHARLRRRDGGIHPGLGADTGRRRDLRARAGGHLRHDRRHDRRLARVPARPLRRPRGDRTAGCRQSTVRGDRSRRRPRGIQDRHPAPPVAGPSRSTC